MHSSASALPDVPLSKIQSSFSNPLFKVGVQTGLSFQESFPHGHSSIATNMASQETSRPTTTTTVIELKELPQLTATNESTNISSNPFSANNLDEIKISLEKKDESIGKSFDSVLSHESSFSKRKSERNKKQTIFYGK